MNEILKKNRDFQKVYNNKNVAGNKIYTMFIKKNNLDFSRIGFTITKKFGHAVQRNKYKRRLKMILRDFEIVPGYDIVIVLKKDTFGVSYQDMKKSFAHILNRKKLIK
ncbi:ribonuclease P protein component [Peptoniphilus koenoeneniae]|uniref:Ribonuclease P protein component n=1 Tax=Peptoniphilus koenoeneniae TaxID=507751 RepID=A0ABU0AWI4_9FIRM|nr:MULTISPECIES: ribonuclease P protein component [Peptoniphilus]ERT60880.1 ribonuclease P protein component [Peptoniphilus sp. BV3C26]MDQ0275167.1 ribonuclease P protein component [Peptoniphilus koenoeneniae]